MPILFQQPVEAPVSPHQHDCMVTVGRPASHLHKVYIGRQEESVRRVSHLCTGRTVMDPGLTLAEPLN